MIFNMIGKGSPLNKKVTMDNGKQYSTLELNPAGAPKKDYTVNAKRAVEIATALGGKFIKD